MVNKSGTGDKLGEIEFGQFGTIEFYDDGDPDDYVSVQHSTNGNMSVSSLIHRARDQTDDDTVMDVLDKLTFDPDESSSEPSGDDSPTVTRGAFSCSDCHKTWPGKRNQNPGTGPNLCPDCAEGEA